MEKIYSFHFFQTLTKLQNIHDVFGCGERQSTDLKNGLSRIHLIEVNLSQLMGLRISIWLSLTVLSQVPYFRIVNCIMQL